MTEYEDRELLNPYEQQARRRFGSGFGRDGTVRRRAVAAVALLLGIAIVGGTVGTSCAPSNTMIRPGAPAQ
jgi:hypothetical protein